jgi:hypothetical protein
VLLLLPFLLVCADAGAVGGVAAAALPSGVAAAAGMEEMMRSLAALVRLLALLLLLSSWCCCCCWYGGDDEVVGSAGAAPGVAAAALPPDVAAGSDVEDAVQTGVKTFALLPLKPEESLPSFPLSFSLFFLCQPSLLFTLLFASSSLCWKKKKAVCYICQNRRPPSHSFISTVSV